MDSLCGLSKSRYNTNLHPINKSPATATEMFPLWNLARAVAIQ